MLLYVRFPLSFRAVEEMMLLRGVQVGYETIRRWCRKFAQQFANELRRRRPKPGDKWHLDEVVLKINGQTYYLWRAVAAKVRAQDTTLIYSSVDNMTTLAYHVAPNHTYTVPLLQDYGPQVQIQHFMPGRGPRMLVRGGGNPAVQPLTHTLSGATGSGDSPDTRMIVHDHHERGRCLPAVDPAALMCIT